MNWIVYSILANISIAYVEYINHAADKPTWLQALPYTAVPIIIAQYALYRAFSGASSMFLAWAVFTVGNSLMRVVSVKYMVNQPVNIYHICGIVGMLASAYVVKLGGK